MSSDPSVLVVCFGNLCRSPMAEGLLRHRLPEPWDVRSAGTNAYGGDPPTPAGQEVMLRLAGIDIGGQRSSALTVTEIDAAAHILTMSVQQARLVAALVPAAAPRVRLYGAFAPATQASHDSADPGGPPADLLEVPDPMGGTIEEYEACLRRLEQATDRIAEWLLEGAPEATGPPALGSVRWPFPQRV